MSPGQDFPHPCTLLGAARLMLAGADLHLKAQAASRLGYHLQARRLWEGLAGAGDADAMYQLAQMAELGLGGPSDALQARTLYLRAAQAGHERAAARLEQG